MIGLSTYAYFWRYSDRVEEPLDLADMLKDAAGLGASVFQICDYAPIDGFDEQQLADIRSLAFDLGLVLELGTKGLAPDHLRRYLAIADRLGVTLLRSMYTAPDDRPTPDEAERRVREILPDLEAAGVTLALETYEQVSTRQLVDLVAAIDSPLVGICLDPANTVAGLELPASVAALCAPHVKNWHVKDFDFQRSPGWVGFVYSGTALGDGRLDYDGIHELLSPETSGINQIVEFWLPWQNDAETTSRLEAEWTRSALDYLRSRNS